MSTQATIVTMLADALADAAEYFKRSTVKLANEVTNYDRLTAEEQQRLGEYTLQEAFDSEGSQIVHTAFDQGYMQACEDLGLKVNAYLKGVN